MNPIEQLIAGFQDLVAQVPALLQPLILMAAGAVPFIEGEGAAIIGLVGGLNPVVAGLAAAAGNFLCVVLVALLTSRARTAVTSRQRVGVPAGPSDEAPEHTESVGAAPSKPASKGRQRFNRWLVRFGVPGASILGPLAIPTQFTTAALVAAGTPRGWVLLWQAVAIVIWTTVATVSALIALQVVSLI
ncbi:small multidrug efflux protein [Microbacterium sp. UBA3394]|uniref:small multidrug efflux protein n=1 Tax=Microbacterium sp. UBA3394 TaxID=1946945 RepID=UPI000C902159|nr:small multidrug efflux protein [Microbacterium sp. UBA3394]MAB81624.1 small multidrug efflux protein [Planctomycetota bacterium]|tara:strand:+ start:8569 stop:9132 length:564 start_codon:yes stop_codon:yes gene_type:complete